jgi:hypothetical protein
MSGGSHPMALTVIPPQEPNVDPFSKGEHEMSIKLDKPAIEHERPAEPSAMSLAIPAWPVVTGLCRHLAKASRRLIGKSSLCWASRVATLPLAPGACRGAAPSLGLSWQFSSTQWPTPVGAAAVELHCSRARLRSRPRHDHRLTGAMYQGKEDDSRGIS